MTVTINGTGPAIFDTFGNVGIGTSSPNYKLDIQNTATTALRVYNLTATNGVLLTQDTSGNSGLNNQGNGYLLFGTNNTERMRIDSSGNVGIGTTSPSSPLNVVSASSSLAIAINGRSSDNLGAMYFYANNGSTQYSTITASATEFRLSSVPAAAVQTFYTNSSERMRIDSSGNVGIGATANASAILDAQSTTKGVRFPNMTTTQKNAISSPAAGLVVFDTTLAKLCVYSGSAWQTITSV